MRSTSFVAFSILIHAAILFAVVLTPIRAAAPDKVGTNPIEVTVGTPAEQPGIQAAPPAVTPPKTEVAPAPAKAVTAARKAAKPKPAAEPPVAPSESAEVPNIASEDANPTVELTPAPETVADGVTAESDTEAQSADADHTDDPAPVAASAEPQDGGSIAKGGATKEGAVSYLDLRQAPGNQPPAYPNKARLENRQGQLELVYRVTADGRVAEVQVAKSSGYQDLDTAAVKAIKQYRFVPGQEGWARHPVVFSLKGQVVNLPSKLRGKGAQNE